MALPRLSLQQVLENIMSGSGLVYFQPGPDVTMSYPCIVYEKDDTYTEHADNQVYSWAQRYQVTLIDRDPDSAIYDKLVALPLCAFNRHFATSGLNHDVFVLYH